MESTWIYFLLVLFYGKLQWQPSHLDFIIPLRLLFSDYSKFCLLKLVKYEKNRFQIGIVIFIPLFCCWRVYAIRRYLKQSIEKRYFYIFASLFNQSRLLRHCCHILFRYVLRFYRLQNLCCVATSCLCMC